MFFFGFFTKKKQNHPDLDDFLGFESKDHCTIFYKDGLFRIDIIGSYTQDNPESLIAHKLVFGSDQDIEDAYAILVRMDNKIDKDALLWHAERLHVTKELKLLLKKVE